MSDETPPPAGEARTVFVPAGGGDVPPSPAPAPVPAPVADDIGIDPAAPLPPAAPIIMSSPPRTYAPMAPRVDGNRIQVGDVLNHIFEVKRFIARGGMGEVFEGANVTSDERVAIKVMLPALAADPNVQTMFRREARTLTRLAHPALVQYRVLAEEPQLGVLYIVTEFIDGTNLSDVLGSIDAAPDALRGLARRLADGLRVAHGLGAIHRDISPDNVLLGDGRIERAKVIDFGIAKDLDPTNKTIVGDGFAGKLNYVAPEQLGDFGREVGPWTDVYSLGLVLIAVARGKDVDMGATLVDAVDRRRAGPDLSPIPASLRDVVAAMTVADPAKRLRSMEAVIAVLDGISAAPPLVPPAEAAKPPKRAPEPKSATSPGAASASPTKRIPLFAGAGAVLALLVAAIAFFALRGGGSKPVAATDPAAPPVVTTARPADPVAAARAAIERASPAVACSWLDAVKVEREGSGVALAFQGVARDPAAAQGAISRALAAAGVSASTLDFGNVAIADAPMCGVLDALRPLRATGERNLSVTQPKFELTQGAGGAQAVIELDVGQPGTNMALLGMEPNGVVEAIDTHDTFLGKVKQNSSFFAKVSEARFRFPVNTTHTGLSGLLRVTGSTPIDSGLLAGSTATRPADWASRVAAEGAKGHWQVEMIWYRTVDEIPG